MFSVLQKILLKPFCKISSDKDITTENRRARKHDHIDWLIGNIEPICPYCDVVLEEKPKRKKKCPHCGNFIYVRVRPKDKQKILVTEAEKEELKRQRSTYSAVFGDIDYRFNGAEKALERERTLLTNKLGHEPREQDIWWSYFNKQLIQHTKEGRWNLYRNTRFNMGEILREEEKLEDALSIYLEVCYLDLCEPDLRKLMAEPDFVGRHPEFFEGPGDLFSGVTGRAASLIQYLALDKEQVKRMVIEVAEPHFKNFSLSLSPKEAWLLLEKEIFE